MFPKFCVVVPCYNPFEGWEKMLCDRLQELELATQQKVKLILVNDSSTSGVTDEAMAFIAECVPNHVYISYPENRGKGYALRKGVEAAQTDLILYTDIDFPYTTDSMVEVLKSLTAGADVAAGTRNDLYYQQTPRRRTIISKLLRFTFKWVFGLPITDTQCGLKGFNQKGKNIFLSTKINRFLFDMEFIALAAKNKSIKLTPVAVSLRHDVVFSRMNLGILTREALNFLYIFKIVHFS